MEEIVKSSYMGLRFWHLVAAIMWPSPDFFFFIWGGGASDVKNKIGKGYIITVTHLDDYFVHSIIFFGGGDAESFHQSINSLKLNRVD